MKAYLAGGCFWCMEKPYHLIEGVREVVSGFSGGEEQDPTYLEVKQQKTMHRETVAIDFDEDKLSFPDLLKVYFTSIDPYDGEGQFIDRGRSYSPAIYYVDQQQKSEAEAMIRDLEQRFGRRIEVAVEPFLRFYAAEEYHQDYARKNPEAYAKEWEESGRKRFHEEQDGLTGELL